MRSLTTLFLGLVLGAFAGAATLFYGLQGLGSLTVTVNRAATVACPCPEGSCPHPALPVTVKPEATASPEPTKQGDEGPLTGEVGPQ